MRRRHPIPNRNYRFCFTAAPHRSTLNKKGQRSTSDWSVFTICVYFSEPKIHVSAKKNKFRVLLKKGVSPAGIGARRAWPISGLGFATAAFTTILKWPMRAASERGDANIAEPRKHAEVPYGMSRRRANTLHSCRHAAIENL